MKVCSWWRQLRHVPEEFIWRQWVHGCSIKLGQHANRASYRKIYAKCYGLCLEGVSSFVWRHVSSNLSLSESDCLGPPLRTYVWWHECWWPILKTLNWMEHGRKGRRSTSKQYVLSLFFFLILVDCLFVAFIFWRWSMAWWYSLSFVRCFRNLFFFVLIRVSFMSCFVLLSKSMFLHEILFSRVRL